MNENSISLVTSDTPSTAPLSDEVRQHAKPVLAFGCDPSAAAKCVNLSPLDWERLLVRDAMLAAELAHVETDAEVHYMKCVHKAAEDAKNYRAAIWWLERMRPDVYGRTRGKTFTKDDVEQFAALVAAHVRDQDDRKDVMDALRKFARR